MLKFVLEVCFVKLLTIWCQRFKRYVIWKNYHYLLFCKSNLVIYTLIKHFPYEKMLPETSEVGNGFRRVLRYHPSFVTACFRYSRYMAEKVTINEIIKIYRISLMMFKTKENTCSCLMDVLRIKFRKSI